MNDNMNDNINDSMDDNMNEKVIELIADSNDIRLDTWLSGKLEKFSRTYICKLVEDGRVTVNRNNVKTKYKLKAGDHVNISLPPPVMLDVTAEDIDLDILYEDQDIIVINKPKGMVVHPAAGNYSGTLVNALLMHCKNSLSDINGVIRPGIVHRIDKNTSGVLVAAKNNNAHEKLSMRLRDHDIERVYVAIVEGIIREDLGKIDAPISRHPVDRKRMDVSTKNGRQAVTHFKVLERFKDATFVQMTLETGRTHQIRVHMAYIGHPILGDEVYGRKDKKYGLVGQTLHARLLGFVHPSTGKYVEFSAEPPEYFNKLLKQLRDES
jgi:23S rRNA pseudouridine1911/1915/1917 synthase